MLQTNDVGELFALMHSTYGSLWKHGADAIPVWQKALKDYNREQALKAFERCIEVYRDYPPTIGLFRELIKQGQEKPSNYLPAPEMTLNQRLANLTMLKVLGEVSGVSDSCLKMMVEFKNAVVEDWGQDKAKKDDTNQLFDELMRMAGSDAG